MKVYGWTTVRYEARTERNRSAQAREIVAAKSIAEVRRLTGMTRSEWEHSGCETGNDEEIAVAMAEPGIIFWQPLDDSSVPWVALREAE